MKPSFYVAKLDTRNFFFTAYGATKKQAKDALQAAVHKHAEQYDIDRNWADDYAEDVVVLPVVLGEGYRDHEALNLVSKKP